MISENEFRKVKKLITALERERDEAAGALKHLEQTLQKDFDCESLEDAAKLLKKMEREYEQLEEDFVKKYNRFIKLHRNELSQLEGIDQELLRLIPSPHPRSKEPKVKREKVKKTDC